MGIERLQLIDGEFPRRALELVLDWAELHRAELLDNWKRCRGLERPRAIEPLH